MGRALLLLVTGVALLASSACSSSSSNTPTSPPPPGSGSTPTAIVSGLVRSANGNTPLAGATVRLSIGELVRTATTPSDGSFRFASLPAGTAQLVAEATGFQSATDSVAIVSSEVVRNLDLTPTPATPTPTPTPTPSPTPSPSPSPSPTPTPTPAPTRFVTLARIIDALGGRGVSGVRGVHPQVTSTASGADGRLELSSTSALGGVPIRFEGDAIISRETFLKVPGADVVVSAIPSTFDLDAFDEMARQPAIKRWLSPPPLVVQRRVLEYADLNSGSLTGSADVRPEGEVSELVSHMTAALPELTGNVIRQFSGVTQQTAAEGSAVPITISGQITVFWVDGLLAGSGYEGFARWEYRNFVITGGVILLDSQSDRGANRQWLRWHELGHTLGYMHVTVRASLMAPSASPITTFDREAGKIAYSRPVGNRSPDIDPDDSSLNAQAPPRWSTWVGSHPAMKKQ